MTEAQNGRKVGALEKDNGGEFTSMKVMEYLARHGTLSIPGRQNKIWTLLKCAQSIRLQVDM